MRPCLALFFTLALLPSSPSARQYTNDPASIPSGTLFNDNHTENVELGDVELDGDWDVAIANGGDFGKEQNRLWVNQGGLQQGVEGFFLDRTAEQLPVISDASRDIEFVDFDNDGDLDLFSVNSSQISPQPSRWWTNVGLLQGGTTGVYVDETPSRWVGLGGPGSSVPSTFVLPASTGGFFEWCHDGEFGDVDNDGDLDLLYTSISGSLTGVAPTRIFLNDGQGFFQEFNPSGYQLVFSAIPDGAPGLWCDGVQQNGTFDTTGTLCDVATAAEDGDLGDIDGDFDLDILLGNRNLNPRMFANRLDGSDLAPAAGGALGFRDVTGAVFSPGYVITQAAYEQELGDLDGDFDLDIVGLNWGKVPGGPYPDKLLQNDGQGLFHSETVLPGSTGLDHDCDYIDFDGDGDLDLYVATLSHDKLYRNETAGAGFVLAAEPLTPLAVFGYALDVDAADTDGDGDLDVLLGHYHEPSVLLRNDYDVPDEHAPAVPRVEAVAAPSAFAGELAVRAHVYDNAPRYITWYADVALEVTVDGALLPLFPMRNSGGQVFRGALPANLVGQVEYRVLAADEHGNQGASAAQSYTAAGDTGATYGAGSPGGGAALTALTETHAGAPIYLRASAAPGAAVFVGVSLSKLEPPFAVPGLPGVVLNVGPLAFLASGTANPAGDFVLGGTAPAGAAGVTLYAQAIALDGGGLASSAGLALVIFP
jgi:hypothetical protein